MTVALASTILPLPPEPSTQTSPVGTSMDSDIQSGIPLELRIPLPSSSPASEYGHEDVKQEEALSADGTREDTRMEHDGRQLLHTTHFPDIGGDQHAGEQVQYSSRPNKGGSISLTTLQPLVASERFHEDRTRLLQAKMEHLRFYCGLQRRLITTFGNASRFMTERFRSVDQQSFVKAYDCCEDLAKEVAAINHPTENTKPFEVESSTSDEAFGPTWIHSLPPVQQDSLLKILNRIRVDPEYLASCFCKLPSAELMALTFSYRSKAPVDSVLPGYQSKKSHGRLDVQAKDSNGASIKDIRGLFQDDPLYTILHGLFDESSGPGSWEYCQRIEVLSTVCARIMVGGKRGSDDLVTTILDSFSGQEAMGAQVKLEAFLLNVLQSGSSLLDLPFDFSGGSKQPVEIRNANAAIASSNFFEKCSADFLALLADELHQVIPRDIIGFVQAVLRKIEDPVLRTRAKNFIVPKWFFCSFVSNILIYPESCGLLMKHHIGDSARQGLLKPLAARVQKVVLEIVSPWNRYSLVDSTTRSTIEKIFSFFEPAEEEATARFKGKHEIGTSQSAATGFLLISPRIAISLIRALCPPAPPSPASTDASSSENASTASSIAASSNLTSGSLGFGSAPPSSLAPSTTGTSMTSHTVLSEFALIRSEPSQDAVEDESSCAHPKAGPPIRDSTDTALLEVCQTLSITFDCSKASSASSIGASDWAMVTICENELCLSPSSADDQMLDVRETQVDSDILDIKSYEVLYDQLDDAVCRVTADAPQESNFFAVEEGSEIGIFATLHSLLRSAMASCESQLDYRAAYYWWQNIETLQELGRLEGSEMVFYKMIDYLADKKTNAIGKAIKVTELLANEVHHLEMLAARQKLQLQAMEDRRGALRDKMWYLSDVKHSKAYEDALNVTHALRLMVDSKRTSRRPSATTQWARQRLRSTNTNDRSQIQVLESLASSKEYGGLSKLADNQVEMITRWMTKHNIENFCKGEEIIHRFCHEIQKCVNKLAGPGMVDSPVLWSSDLFKHEKRHLDTRRITTSIVPGASAMGDPRRLPSSVELPPFKPASSPSSSSTPLSIRNLAANTPKTINGFWQATKPAPNFMEGISYFKQPQPNPSETPTAVPSPTYHQFGQHSRIQHPTGSSNHEVPPSKAVVEASKAHKAFADGIRTTITALLLSDLGYIMWSQGSETDIWINGNKSGIDPQSQSLSYATQIKAEPLSMASSSALSDALSDSTITFNQREPPEDHTTVQPRQIDKSPRSASSDSKANKLSHDSKSKPSHRETPFPFSDAYERLLAKFSSTSDPSVKLDTLAELESIVMFSVSQSQKSRDGYRGSMYKTVPTNSALRSQGLNIPRTKATSLEEVVANCTERRAGTMRYTDTKASSRGGLKQAFYPPDTDAIVDALLNIFRNDELRPATLYRDLQFIATFIPSEILDQSAKGKAFWDVGLAALAYKEERCEAMIHQANQITNYHVSVNKDTSSFMNAYSPDLVDTSLGDAAQLLVTIAKEGSPVACRELGLFYLTHPELLPRVTLPFSKSKDVFKSVTSSDRTSIETGGLDPLTFAVVFHWMELAANGGDKDARNFIRGNGELSTARS